MIKKVLIVISVILFWSTEIIAQVNLFVSADGDDSNPGTTEQPLATLQGARDVIRKMEVRNEAINVIIAEGTYYLSEPLVFTSEDGGTATCPVIYKAATGSQPVISGGIRITDFKINENGIWETKIPGYDENKWRFDQLYVNGKRAIMARTPNSDFLRIGSVKQTIEEKGDGRVAKKARQELFFDANNFESLQQLESDQLQNLRFKAYHKWDFTLRYIDEINKDSLSVLTSGKGMKPWNPMKNGTRIVFENYFAALDAPGEWYLDNKGVLFYKPLPGQTPENTEIIAPYIDCFIQIKGDISSEKTVRHLSFEGLSFKYCHYAFPQSGSEPNQAASHINASIQIEGASDITFRNCEIAHTGQHAIWFGKGCFNSKVLKCHLYDLGGGGIYLGDRQPSDGTAHTHHIHIENNIIQTGGREFPSAVGVWIGHSSDNVIIHNDIGDFYYTGISVGWIWGYKESTAKRNIISYNRIHHIGWDHLSDMAGVYTLGDSKGTIISNNLIHHIHAYSYGGWGLYTDEGSSGIIMKNNLVYNTKTGGFHQHYGKENIITNNIFAYAKLYQAQCTRVENHHSFDFTKNIIVFDTGFVLKGAWNKIDILMDSNIYWNTSGDSTYNFNGSSFQEWQKTGHDTNSFCINPGFVDPVNFDFTLKNRSYTDKIGFIPFNISKAGVYGEKEWLEKAILDNEIRLEFDKVVRNNIKQNPGRG